MTLILSGTDGVSDIDGTAATPAIRGTDANTGIFFPAADTIGFAEGGAEAMRINSSGNVGIGTTNPGFKLDITDATTSQDSGGIRLTLGSEARSHLITNTTPNASSGRDLGVLAWRDLLLKAGQGTTEGVIRVNSYEYTTFGTGSSYTERMRIDSSGNVGIGTTSVFSGAKLQVSGTSATQYVVIENTSGSDAAGNRYSKFYFRGRTAANAASNLSSIQTAHEGSSADQKGYLTFHTNGGSDNDDPTERARITSGGFFKASNSGSYASATGTYHEMRSSTVGSAITYFVNSAASNPYGITIDFTGTTPNNTTEYFLGCGDPTNQKLTIYSSGTVTNRTGTYNSFSDLKLKQDVVDASSQWNDIKALRIVKYRLKDEVSADPNYPAYIGVIAQEVEQVSPGLIDNCQDFENVTKTREIEKTREVTPAVLDDEGNEVTPAVTETYTETEEYTERVATGTVTKSVKYSILYMKAVKALQEAQLRIETLEAQNAAFEARLAALENK